MPWMMLAHAVFALAFTWIYLQGREDDKPWLAQGIRYGIAVACLALVPIYLIYHVVTLVPLDVAFKQIVFDTVRVVLMGIVLAWINRGATTDIPDGKIEVLLSGPPKPTIVNGLAPFSVSRLADAKDRDALLNEIGPRVRAIASSVTSDRIGADLMSKLPKLGDRLHLRRRLRPHRRRLGG